MPLSKHRKGWKPAKSKTPELSPRGSARRAAAERLFRDSARMEADIGRNPVHIGGQGFGAVPRDSAAHKAWQRKQKEWLRANT